MLNIDDLLDEELIHILGYLTVCELKMARLVCKRWNTLSLKPSLLRRQMTVVPDYGALDELDFDRRYINIRVEGNESCQAKSLSQFWLNCGENLTHLQLSFNEMKDLHRITHHTPNLTSLNVGYCHDSKGVRGPPVPICLPKLIELKIMANISGHYLDNLVANALKLQHFSVYFFRDPSKEFGESVRASIKRLVKRQGNILKSLCMSGWDADGQGAECLSDICPMFGPQMTSLEVTFFRHLDSVHLSVISPYLPNLTEINLNGTNCDDAVYFELVASLKYLTRIHLMGTPIAKQTISLIGSLTQLKFLDIGYCKKIPMKCLHKALGTHPHPNLVHLDLFALPITNAIVKDIVQHAPGLEYLHLESCKFLTNNSLKVIAKSCKKMRYLNIDFVYDVSDISVLNNLKNLSVFSARGCDIKSSTIAALQLPKLLTFDISNYVIKKNDYKVLLSNSPYLSRNRKPWNIGYRFRNEK